MNATTVSFATELLLDILLGSFALMSITGLVCTIQSAIYDHRRGRWATGSPKGRFDLSGRGGATK